MSIARSTRYVYIHLKSVSEVKRGGSTGEAREDVHLLISVMTSA